MVAKLASKTNVNKNYHHMSIVTHNIRYDSPAKFMQLRHAKPVMHQVYRPA